MSNWSGKRLAKLTRSTPINVFATHSYGPVLLAGAEVFNLLKNKALEINDSAVMMKDVK